MNTYQQLSNYGLNEADILWDSTLHRFNPPGRNDESGWYVGFNNIDDSGKPYQVLVVGDWSKNLKSVFYSKSDLTPKEIAKVQNKIRYRVEQAKKLKHAQYEAVSLKATNIFENLSHPKILCKYLANKKIDKFYGSKFDKDCLLIPVIDNDGKIWSLQRIYADGSKKFLKGGKIKGNYFVVGEIKNVIYLCEGFATACTIHMATNEGVVCAFNVGNCENVYKSLAKKYPNKEIIFCADNDQFKEINAGANMAENLFNKFKVEFRLPRFISIKNKPTDFNDLHVFEGIEAVKKCIGDVSYQSDVQQKEIDNLMYWKSRGFFSEIVDSKGNVKDVPMYKKMAKYMSVIEHFKCDDSYKAFYLNDHYVLGTKNKMMKQILSLSKDQCSPAHLDAFHKMILAECYYPKENLKTKSGFINLANGVLDISNSKIFSHDHSYNFTYKLNHNFNVNARCDRFLEFLNFIFDGDNTLIDLIGEIMGYTIIGGEPFKHRAFCFYGTGRNGKSTLLDVISELLGEANVSNVSMKLLDKPFSMVRMDGKLANIVEESPSNIDPEAFKNIVGGGKVTAAQKGMAEYDLRVFARLFFACNEYPHFKDSTKGNRDRLIIIPFKKYIPDSERDHGIKSKLFAEMSGILNFALEGWDRLRMNNFAFTKSKSVDDSLEEFKKETDSVYDWVVENLKYTGNESDKLITNEIYKKYRADMEEGGTMCVSIKSFGKRLSNSMPEIENCRILQNGKKLRGFKKLLYK